MPIFVEPPLSVSRQGPRHVSWYGRSLNASIWAWRRRRAPGMTASVTTDAVWIVAVTRQMFENQR